MGRHPLIPAALTRGPFTVEDALREGLTRRQLQGTNWRRMSVGQYAWAGITESHELYLASVLQRLPSGAAFSGQTAGWLHGLDLAPCNPIEVTVPRARGVTALAGVSVSRTVLADFDIVVRRGLPTTSPVRTVFDLGSRPPLVEAVVAVDMALHAGLVDLAGMRKWAAEHYGSKGIRQFRRVLDFVEPATESPMETRLRMLLVSNGVPKPEVQVAVHDDNGRFLGRADLYYPDHRLVLEYDGGTHRTSLIEDNRRQNLLISAGFRILRFTFADVNGTPDAVVSQVRAALRR